MKALVGNYGDIAQATRLCKVLHADSSWTALEFNAQHVRKQLMNIVRTDGMDMLLAKDDDGVIQGVLLATVDQFFICKQRYATDIHFMCRRGGIQLLAEFKRWAREHGARKIIMGIANDDPNNRIARFYEMAGMQNIGDAWVMDIEELQEMAA